MSVKHSGTERVEDQLRTHSRCSHYCISLPRACCISPEPRNARREAKAGKGEPVCPRPHPAGTVGKKREVGPARWLGGLRYLLPSPKTLVPCSGST